MLILSHKTAYHRNSPTGCMWSTAAPLPEQWDSWMMECGEWEQPPQQKEDDCSWYEWTYSTCRYQPDKHGQQLYPSQLLSYNGTPDVCRTGDSTPLCCCWWGSSYNHKRYQHLCHIQTGIHDTYYNTGRLTAPALCNASLTLVIMLELTDMEWIHMKIADTSCAPVCLAFPLMSLLLLVKMHLLQLLSFSFHLCHQLLPEHPYVMHLYPLCSEMTQHLLVPGNRPITSELKYCISRKTPRFEDVLGVV